MARSSLSDMQTSLIQWLLEVHDVPHIPTASQLKTSQAHLQRLSGVGARRCVGSLGHTYYVNDIGRLLAQEVANPLVQPHVRLYPEMARGKVSDTFHGK
ncbi:hypothetical protein JB92DRAFT_3295213 [Gautieria morchelliformis]|nr:hypothetical protein JB92DRAFT_3295213 [Gautieria morchelliformis]